MDDKPGKEKAPPDEGGVHMNCFLCQDAMSACFGYLLAREVLDKGEPPADKITCLHKVLCGTCAERLSVFQDRYNALFRLYLG